MTPIEVKLFLQ